MYSNKLICQILIFLNNNINNKIYIDDLEQKFFYNRFYIMKLFKKEIGVSIIDYINYIRIYNSFFEIINTNNKLLQVAYNNGFYSLEYFSETFKKIIGINPKKIKKTLFLDRENIYDQIIKINIIKNNVEKYLLNQKPENNKVLKLTIFK